MSCAVREIVPDPLLAHLAPVGWRHINLTGDYLWDADSCLGPDGFRSLRTPAPNLRPGSRHLTVFPMGSCVPCYPAYSMA